MKNAKRAPTRPILQTSKGEHWPGDGPQPAPEHAPQLRVPTQHKIIAFFGARAFFGSERANIEALAALQSEGCHILCAIRNEDWPELRRLQASLTSRNLVYERFMFIDIPRKGWLTKILL